MRLGSAAVGRWVRWGHETGIPDQEAGRGAQVRMLRARVLYCLYLITHPFLWRGNRAEAAYVPNVPKIVQPFIISSLYQLLIQIQAWGEFFFNIFQP